MDSGDYEFELEILEGKLLRFDLYLVGTGTSSISEILDPSSSPLVFDTNLKDNTGNIRISDRKYYFSVTKADYYWIRFTSSNTQQTSISFELKKIN